MSPRAIRRAAERKLRKEALRQEKAREQQTPGGVDDLCRPSSIEPQPEGAVSPAQLAANRANAEKSTGPRTASGKATSSKNAVKSALTGQTVLLPSDDRDEYERFLAGFQEDLKPVGLRECELVQIVVDCHWRLRRIQTLEYALYAHGEEQFADMFQDTSEVERHSKIILQTHLTYEKQLRNLHIQEARIDRKRAKALDEFRQLQSERTAQEQPDEADPEMSFEMGLAAFQAGYIPPSILKRMKENAQNQNGFDFSNQSVPPNPVPDFAQHGG